MGGLKRPRFLFDECVPSVVVECMQRLNVAGISTLKGQDKLGVSDLVVAEVCSSGGFTLVTMDRKQLIRAEEIAALQSLRVRAVFLPTVLKQTKLWDLMAWFIRHWTKISAEAATLRPGQILLVDLKGRLQMCADAESAAKIEERRVRMRKGREQKRLGRDT